jgi:hypothetical protein
VRTNTTASVKTNGAKGLVFKKEDPKSGVRDPASATEAPHAGGLAIGSEDGDADAEPDVPALDVTLEEVKRILTDYISAVNKAKGVAFTKPAGAR